MDESANQFPEQVARDNIDKQLHATGWAVQDKDKINWDESVGVAIGVMFKRSLLDRLFGK